MVTLARSVLGEGSTYRELKSIWVGQEVEAAHDSWLEEMMSGVQEGVVFFKDGK